MITSFTPVLHTNITTLIILIMIQMKKCTKHSQIDFRLLTYCIFESLLGIVLIFSATRYLSTLRYVLVQTLALFIGIIIYIMASRVSIDSLCSRYHNILFSICIIAILLLLTPLGVGEETTGNRSWLDIPFIPINIQPAEFAKIPYTMVLSHYFSKSTNPQECHVFSAQHKALLFCCIMILLIVIVSGDYGMALIYGGIFIVLAWLNGTKIRWFIGGVITAITAGILLWDYIPYYIKMRILVVLDHSLDPTGKGWQQTRSLIAIGGGGLTGQGYLQGQQTQSALGLPARHTDEIFAVCGEEFGFIGCVICILGLCFIIGRCFRITNNSPSRLLMLIAIGFTGSLSLQVIINIGVALYILPVVGLTLPFLSYGGSSMISLFLSMGLLSNISSHSKIRR